MLRIPSPYFRPARHRFGNGTPPALPKDSLLPLTKTGSLEVLQTILNVRKTVSPAKRGIEAWLTAHSESPDEPERQAAEAVREVEDRLRRFTTSKGNHIDRAALDGQTSPKARRKLVYRLAYLPGDPTQDKSFHFYDVIGQTGTDGKLLWDIKLPAYYNDQLTLLRDLRLLGILKYTPSNHHYILTPQMRLILQILKKMEPFTPRLA